MTDVKLSVMSICNALWHWNALCLSQMPHVVNYCWWSTPMQYADLYWKNVDLDCKVVSYCSNVLSAPDRQASPSICILSLDTIVRSLGVRSSVPIQSSTALYYFIKNLLTSGRPHGLWITQELPTPHDVHQVSVVFVFVFSVEFKTSPN